MTPKKRSRYVLDTVEIVRCGGEKEMCANKLEGDVDCNAPCGKYQIVLIPIKPRRPKNVK